MSGGLASSATARTSSLVPPHANSFRQGLPLDGSDTVRSGHTYDDTGCL